MCVCVCAVCVKGTKKSEKSGVLCGLPVFVYGTFRRAVVFLRELAGAAASASKDCAGERGAATSARPPVSHTAARRIYWWD